MGDVLAGVLIAVLVGCFIAAGWHGAHLNEDMCGMKFGTKTRDYALCVYELDNSLRKEP